MKTATAQRVLLDMSDPMPRPVLPASADAVVADDGLPPPTKAHVFYWGQLCGELRLRGTAGIPDPDGWPADLRPSRTTLKQLVARGLVARRDRAWKLRQRWYERLTALKARAVNTPPLAPIERPAPSLPTYAELEAWEAICRWLDAQPGRRARLPFVGLALLLRARDVTSRGGQPPGPFAAERMLLGCLVQLQQGHDEAERSAGEHATLLKEMRRHRLVRHTKDCGWALSPKWREKLTDLHTGMDRALREYAPPQLQPAAARSLCAGLDTWGLNWLVEEKALPPRLRLQLDDLQEMARAGAGEVDTAWVYDGVPLRMYQAGVRAKGDDGKKAKGVSWSYILVNPSLRLLIRRTPLGGIVANARLGSECLWRRTPRAALDELHALIRRLWGKDHGRWQVSYAHLAHDVANAPLEREQLDRYVSRSRRQAVYDAAKAEMQRLLREACPRDAAGADLNWDMLPMYDWEAEYGEDEEVLLADSFAEEGYEWDRTPKAVKRAKEALEGEIDKRSITSYIWGKRLSGVAFSPGGAVSFVMYRKDWEGRLKQKRHMEPLWKAAGWDGKEPVTRHEARLVREPLRELRGASDSDRALLDDPWQFLVEVQGVWARMVGRADACPEAVDVAWIRRVVPREGESNRSRWDTDPVWRVVQAANFASAPLAARRLVRWRQRKYDLRTVDRGLLGLLKRREALLHPNPEGRDVSLAAREAVAALERELQARGDQFDEAVRRKRQEIGLPVKMASKLLVLRPMQDSKRVKADRTPEIELERAVDDLAPEKLVAAGTFDVENCEVVTASPGGRWGTWAWLRAKSAEARMREAFAALEAAEAQGQAPREVERLITAFERASEACDAAEVTLARACHAGACQA